MTAWLAIPPIRWAVKAMKTIGFLLSIFGGAALVYFGAPIFGYHYPIELLAAYGIGTAVTSVANFSFQ